MEAILGKQAGCYLSIYILSSYRGSPCLSIEPQWLTENALQLSKSVCSIPEEPGHRYNKMESPNVECSQHSGRAECEQRLLASAKTIPLTKPQLATTE